MFDKVRNKVAGITKRAFNRKSVKDFIYEFLPRDRYLEIKLREICSQCPLYGDGKRHRRVSNSDRENIDMCRRRYFGLLLQSFVGKPRDEETNWLYSCLKRCEDCWLSRAGNGRTFYMKSGRKTSGERIAHTQSI
jgi:hypothetical protein